MAVCYNCDIRTIVSTEIQSDPAFLQSEYKTNANVCAQQGWMIKERGKWRN